MQLKQMPLPLPDWPHVAAAMGIDHVMLARPDGQIELSPKMKQRVHLLDTNKPAIVRELKEPTSP